MHDNIVLQARDYIGNLGFLLTLPVYAISEGCLFADAYVSRIWYQGYNKSCHLRRPTRKIFHPSPQLIRSVSGEQYLSLLLLLVFVLLPPSFLQYPAKKVFFSAVCLCYFLKYLKPVCME